MRSLWNRSGIIPLLAAGVIACDGGTDPDPIELVDVLLDFCASDTPVFFAHLNERANWVRVLPDAQGTFAFEASPTVALAIVQEGSAETSTEYVYTTPEDLEPLNGVNCIEQNGFKSLNGSVAGVSLGSGVVVTMASSSEIFEAPDAAYTLTGLPNGPYDLVATREVLGTSSVAPDRVIIRRAQDRANGSTIPVLDFASTEAVATTVHTVTANGLSSGEQTQLLFSFSTPTTRRHSLSLTETFTSPTRTLYGIPATLTQAGDLHELEVFADAETAYRGEVQWYRQPSNRTVTLGSALATPALSLLPSSTQLRPRTQLPAQAEYDDLVSVTLQQSGRQVVVTATAGYFGGTPATWDLSVPDLTNVPGFPSSARLLLGQNTDWYVDAYGGTGGAAAFFGRPADNTTLHFAGRAFATSGATASSAARIEGRGRHGPLRPGAGIRGR